MAGRNRKRERGTAAVEMLLLVPFLMIFAVALVDFSHGFRTRSKTLRATRHVAWMAARHEAYGAPAAPTQEQMRTTHLHRRNTEVKLTVDTDVSAGIPLPGGLNLGDVFSAIPVQDMKDLFGGVFEGLTELVVMVPGYLTGSSTLTSATVESKAPGTLVWQGITVASRKITDTHFVGLDSRREDNPSDPMAWFDPYQWIKEQIEGLFKT